MKRLTHNTNLTNVSSGGFHDTIDILGSFKSEVNSKLDKAKKIG